MSFFKRLFKIGEAEAHAVVEKLEDPIKLTEQGIRDLKKDLDKTLQAIAEVKAVAIRSKKEMVDNQDLAKTYEHKAILLIQKAQSGDIETEKADRLATEVLAKKESAMQAAAVAKTNYDQLQTQINALQGNVEKLKTNITKYESELKMLKARARVSSATKKLNKSISGIDSSGTIATLERMKDKVEQDEAMAQAYGEMAVESRSVDAEIDDLLSETNEKVSASVALEELKAKMNK